VDGRCGSTSPKGEKKHKVLAATGSRSLITTFRDRTALLDNPLEEAVDDTLFGSNYMLLRARARRCG